MNPDDPSSQPATIMVVDDVLDSLQMLTDGLEALGYDVRPVLSGETALEVATWEPPDLILLDINMPGLNGYETCTRLRDNLRTAAIPVIFLSAMDEAVDKVKAFAVGAVDYVTKPFQFDEVEARIRTHLELARLRLDLERTNSHLEDMVMQRTAELTGAHERLTEAYEHLAVLDQAKSDFLTLISRELREPLGGVIGVAERLMEESPSEVVARHSQVFQECRSQLVSLVDDALLLCQVGPDGATGLGKTFQLDSLLQETCRRVTPVAQIRDVQLESPPPVPGSIPGEPEHMRRALKSLLELAVKFARSGTTVRIAHATDQREIRLFFEADGCGVPPESVPRFFQLMGTSSQLVPNGDPGLAPALAERIVSLYGGSVSIENLSSPGVRLTVRLKKAIGRGESADSSR